MLYSLHVKNLALIKEQEIEFTKGLNILTGETGAGKSVVIGSVNLALGAKADATLIRTGEEYALCELVFGIDNDYQRQLLKEMDIPVEEDGTLLLQRKIMQGRSVSKAGGENVTISQLREIAGILINIHGQNDHQELLNKKKHLEVLDNYCSEELLLHFEKLAERYKELKELESKLKESDIDETARKREQELLQFEVDEITEAALKEGEDEELESSYKKMVNSRRISEAVNTVSLLTGYNEASESASDMTGRAIRELSSVSSYDPDIEELVGQISDIDSLLTDFNHALSEYQKDLEFDDDNFRSVEERLNIINHLKDKYGQSIDQVLDELKKKEERLNALTDLEAYREGLSKEYDKAKKDALLICKEISDIRKKGAKGLSEKLKKALIDLNFLDVKFEIKIDSSEDKISERGYDDVEFMISTNPGEELRPLNQIASGGELSRIMLGLKNVVADKDDISTLIFDEIDAGISGKTAWMVSQKLGELSRDHQIICITHLPQIAAMADTHFLIEKNLSDNRTVTDIKKLSDEESIGELSRLLGGDVTTEATLTNAREMKDKAEEVKRNSR